MEVLILATWFLLAWAEFDHNFSHIEEFLSRKNQILKKKYRPMYHITSPVGWLSDPAAFIYYKQQYHLFYQYHSYDGAWGLINWGHVVSNNLVKWTFYPRSLMPGSHYDKQGCLAGSAVIHDGYLSLFYTGNLIVNNKTVQNQNIAVSSGGIIFQKYLYNPVVPFPPASETEFRNPKVWEFDNHWYMLLGATGVHDASLLLYTSPDMFNWSYKSTVASSYGGMGTMWENPDFFELNGVHVLILSVQGLNNITYQSGYVTGKFNYDKLKFDHLEISASTFIELDYGHDFYAPKTTESKDGRRLLVAWLGSWDSQIDDVKAFWPSMLTLVRELSFNDEGKLLMKPVREVIDLRGEMLEDAWYSPGEVFSASSKSYELMVNASSTMYDASISLEWSDGRYYTILYNTEHGIVSVNRAGVTRTAGWRPLNYIYWHIFVDYYSIEVFCGEGEVVFSSRISSEKAKIRIAGEAQLHITQYKLKRSVGYSKAVRQHLKERVINNKV